MGLEQSAARHVMSEPQLQKFGALLRNLSLTTEYS